MQKAEIENLRKEAGFKTQLKVAAFLGVSPQSYRNWLSGKYPMPEMAFRMLKLAAWIKNKKEDPWEILAQQQTKLEEKN